MYDVMEWSCPVEETWSCPVKYTWPCPVQLQWSTHDQWGWHHPTLGDWLSPGLKGKPIPKYRMMPTPTECMARQANHALLGQLCLVGITCPCPAVVARRYPLLAPLALVLDATSPPPPVNNSSRM